jgi:uncharacterized membrane protein YgdD (TMEM256/DUF423 family)
MNPRATLVVSAVMGFLAVSLGAFGAHGLKATLEANNQVANWGTAAQYHLIHAVGLLALALHAPLRVWAWRCWVGGIVIFSGSLYALALSNVKILGAITPIGGLLLLAGWALLAIPEKKQV